MKRTSQVGEALRNAQQDQLDAAHRRYHMQVEQLMREVAMARQDSRGLVEAVTRLVQIVEAKIFPSDHDQVLREGDHIQPAADLMSSASSVRISQENRYIDCVNEVFKLEAGMSRMKSAEWFHLVEISLQRSSVPQDRWVSMAGNWVDSYYKRMFTDWEHEDPTLLNWARFRHNFITKVAGYLVSIFVANKRLNQCCQMEQETISLFISRFEQEMLNHRETNMYLPQKLRHSDFQYYHILKLNLLDRFADCLTEKERDIKDWTDLTPVWARRELSQIEPMVSWEPRHSEINPSQLMDGFGSRFCSRTRGRDKRRKHCGSSDTCWHCGQTFTGWAHKKECPRWPKKQKPRRK